LEKDGVLFVKKVGEFLTINKNPYFESELHSGRLSTILEVNGECKKGRTSLSTKSGKNVIANEND
jgi:hypothetical protein